MSGRRVSLFSYGSGCGATFCLGKVAETASRWASSLDPSEALEQRRLLDMDSYERFVRDGEDADLAEVLDPAAYGLPGGGLYYVGTQDHQRRYER